MNSYEFHIGDYYRRAKNLSQIEHYIYRSLIDEYYLAETPFPPNDLRSIMRLIGLTTDQSEDLGYILKRFFILYDDGWHHLHVEEQLEKIYAKSDKARESAKIRWDKYNKVTKTSERNANAQRTDSERNADGMLPSNPLTPKPKETAANKPPNYSNEDYEVAEYIWKQISAVYDKAKKPNLDNWAKKVSHMREYDKRTHREIMDLICWATRHDFWHQNIRSPEKLRKQWDTLWVQRKAQSNGGGIGLKLPRDDEALMSFAKSNGLPSPLSGAGESFIQYRNRLNGELEKRNK